MTQLASAVWLPTLLLLLLFWVPGKEASAEGRGWLPGMLGAFREMLCEAQEPGFLCAQHRVWQLLLHVRWMTKGGRYQDLAMHPAIRTKNKSHNLGLVAAQEGCPEEFRMV